MDRNREVRRAQPMANGLPRRRPQRNGGSGMRDSPEEAVAGELQEMAAVRLRDRKKDRLSRSKRRRGERLHGNREEGGDESSEESVDIEEEDDDEDEDSSVANHRRGNPPAAAKIVKPPWKVPDEMIGVPVPRKARSASVKRSHESSGSGGGGGDQFPALRQCSTSPATPSAASVSPPSSNASIRRRVKPIGAKQRPAKVAKVSNQEEIEIEVAEVLFGLRQYPAPSVNPELAGNPSSMKVEDREEESSTLVGKARASSPLSPQQSVGLPPKALSSMAAASPALGAPKRKRPRPVKPEEEKSGFGSGVISTISASSIDEAEKMEVSSPKGDKNSLDVVPNGVDGARSIKFETNQESEKFHLIQENKPAFLDATAKAAEEKVIPDVICSEKSEPQVELTGLVKPEVSSEDATKGFSSSLSTCDGQKEQNFKIDLMAPPAKSMMDGDTNGDSTLEIEAVNAKEEIILSEGKEKAVPKVQEEVPSNDSELEKRAEMSGAGEQAKQSKDRMLDLHMDVEISDREGCKQHGQKNSKVARGDMKAPDVYIQKEKPAPHGSGTAPAMAGPAPLPHVTIPGWPGGLPPIGYIGQAPASWPGAPPAQAVVSMEGNPGAPTLQPHILLPHQRYKRCATHCFIAKMISYLQHIARINPFWAAASNASLFGAKPCNLNAMPSTEGMILAGPISGAFPAANFTTSGRTAASIQDKGNGNAATYGSHTPKEKASAQVADGPRKQQTAVQQPTIAPSAANIPVAAAVRPGGSETPVSGHAVAPSAAQVGGSGAVATVNYNYANFPTNEAQYIAMVQGSDYPFQIPAHVGAAAAASAYRSSSVHLGQAAAAPPPQFFSGSFYASQMLHPSQIQQAQSQAPQQGQQNPSTSSGSSSSHKHSQQQRLQGGGGSSSHNYKQQQQLQQEPQLQVPQKMHQSPSNSVHPHHNSNASQPCQREAGHPAEGDSPSAADRKVSPNFLTHANHHLHPTVNTSYGISPLPVPIHHAQNFSIMSSLGSTKNGEKQLLQPQSSDPHLQYSLKGMEFLPSQTFAMSFPPGIDFSMAQGHHAIFQNLPESYRQSYQLAAAQAVAAAASAQQQHVQRPTNQKIGDDSKSASDHIGGAISQEERTAGGTKAAPAVASHTLTFSRQSENNENASISIFGSSPSHVSNPAILENQSRSLNLVSAPANGTRVSCPTSSSTTNTQQSQQQSQFIARSKSGTSNANVPTVSLQTAIPVSYTDRLPVNMFPGGLSAFPQALIPGTAQSPQWKSAAAVSNARTVASASLPSPQKQPKGPVAGPGSSAVHSQISFANNGVNAKVTAMPMGGHVTHGLPNSSSSSNVSNAAPARPHSSTPITGSPSPSITKSSGNPSTRTAAATKGGVLPTPVPAASQPQKNSHTSSNRKSSPPLGGRNNLPSSFGHPQLVQGSSLKQSQQQPVQPSNLKTQHQSQPQLNKAQYQPAQIYFANNYLAAQSSQAPPHAAAGYYPKPSSSVQSSICNLPQRRPSSEQSQNLTSVSSNSAATGALSLGGSSLSLTSSAPESLKSGNTSNAAPRGSVGVLHTHQFTTPLSTAANPANNPTAAAVVAAAFPYLHAVSTVPMKSADHSSAGTKQKQEKIQ
ncbi:protein TIME FOR COFFEE-like isoform X2 [Nymphaea colorata]|uniref:protein TIME FOR COFFEE-like isoform X2 n=1 Tax=Nymphaea colorata TaxID=210225 RepID=UPI00129EC7A6|nr:protein TIME FOR COFFEE-like isoform X2 [Nymphaea colorata]